jgi:hypothetical protein
MKLFTTGKHGLSTIKEQFQFQKHRHIHPIKTGSSKQGVGLPPAANNGKALINEYEV